MDDIDKKWAEFELMGEESVRKQLTNNIWNQSKNEIARGWLDYKARADSSDLARGAVDREERMISINSKLLEATESASKAAWIAAKAAIAAAIIAAAALAAMIIIA